jgi:hypothetical protein
MIEMMHNDRTLLLDLMREKVCYGLFGHLYSVQDLDDILTLKQGDIMHAPPAFIPILSN